MTSRIVSIQILRGIAASLVVIAHVIEHPLPIDALPDWALITGIFGVDIFFVVSGFVIVHITGAGRFDPFGFAVRRVLRIVPLYWACTILTFVLVLTVPAAFKRTVADVPHVLASLAFVPHPDPLNPSDWRPLLKLGWSLNYEMFFYLLAAATFWCRSAVRRAGLLTAALVPLIAASTVVAPNASLLAHYANANLIGFVFGMWLAIGHRGGLFGGPGDKRVAATVLAAIAAVAATALLYGRPASGLGSLGGHLVMSVAAAAIVATGLFGEAWLRADRHSFAERIGDWSYSLYLTHMFVVGAMAAAAGVAARRWGIDGIAAQIGFGVVTVALSLAVAAVSYRLIEVPSQWLGRRIGRKPATDGHAIAVMGHGAPVA